MRSVPRYIPALVLTLLYAMIVMSPLAPLAMRSAIIAHAVTGECAGDCSICGCSTERSANRTCCCWQKKQQLVHGDEQDEPDCCKKQHAENKNKTASIKTMPCSSGKSMVAWGAEQSDVLPYRFSLAFRSVHETALFTCNPASLSDRPGDPPDPPPKLS
jgi:hypothetical protein